MDEIERNLCKRQKDNKDNQSSWDKMTKGYMIRYKYAYNAYSYYFS